SQLDKDDATFDSNRFITVQCDIALHDMQLGRYKYATQYLKKGRPLVGSMYELDKVYCGMTQCFFYCEIGFFQKSRSLLSTLSTSETFRTRFFQIEKTLIEARMPDVSA